MRLLMVENNERFAATVCGLLLSAHEVVVVPTMSQARSRLRGARFDAVLVDYDLDDGKGEELVAELRRSRPDLPLVAISSHEFGNGRLMAAGASVTCSKMQFQRIGEVLEGLLSGSDRER